MPESQTRARRQLARAVDRAALSPRRAVGIIASYTVGVTVIGGVAVWLVDRHEFPTLGDGLWWAVQTVTTVGYGDVVPESTWGRLIATVVILSGTAFLTVITAAVTASLIESARRRRHRSDEEMGARFDEVSARLAAIEDSLRGRQPPA